MDFELEWRDRRVPAGQTVRKGRPYKTPRRFLGFVIGGASLYDVHGMEEISVLGWLSPGYDEQAARRLLLKEEPDFDGRVALYICAECGDLDCGAITAKIDREADEFVWREMGLSLMDWSGGVPRHDRDDFAAWQELRFPASQYAEAIGARPRPNLIRSGR